MRKWAAAGAVSGALLALPAVADAAVICVPASLPGCDSSAATPQTAADAAAKNDTIRIAAGEHPGVVTDKRLTFVGEGSGTVGSAAGATVVTGIPASPTALNLHNGGTMRRLRLRGLPGTATYNPGHGVSMLVDDDSNRALVLEDVIAEGGARGDSDVRGSDAINISYPGLGGLLVPTLAVRGGALLGGDGGDIGVDPQDLIPPGRGLQFIGQHLRASFADVFVRGGSLGPDRPKGPGILVWADSVSHVLLDDVAVQGGTAVWAENATTIVRRSTLEGDRAGLLVRAETAVRLTTELVHSFISAVTPSGWDGWSAVDVSGEGAELRTRGSTIYARGRFQAGLGAGGATTSLTNTLIVAETVPRYPVAPDIRAGGAVTASHSAFRTLTGPGPAPGSGTNVSADPMVDASLFPLPGSPLVDAGDPSVVEPGESDRLGSPRSLDGNGDCIARPDIGAFERPAIECDPAPRVSRFTMTHRRFAPVRRRSRAARRVPRGTRFRFVLSEPARVQIAIERLRTGRRVKSRCVARKRRNRRAQRCLRVRRVGTLKTNGKTGRNSLRFTGRLKDKPLRAGRHRATITARDERGAASRPRTLRFRIVRPSTTRR